MFKPLTGYFTRKKKNIEKNSTTNTGIDKIIEEFLIESFNSKELISLIKTEFNSQDNIVTIITPNKIIANEILLRLNNLYSLFSKNNLSSVKVLIK